MVRTPYARAASANRTTPYIPSWSVSAIASRPSRAASSASSSGWLAPSRKLKLEWQCSSANGTRSPPGAGGRSATTGARCRDQAGLSPPSPGCAPSGRRPDSARSSSAHGIGGLSQPISAPFRRGNASRTHVRTVNVDLRDRSATRRRCGGCRETAPSRSGSLATVTTILITGSTAGLGRALAARVADAGATVLVHGRDPGKVARAAAEVGGIALVADLSSMDAVRALAAEVRSRTDRLDVLVNNAGLGGGPQTQGRQLSPDGYELRFAVNYLATFLLTQELLP